MAKRRAAALAGWAVMFGLAVGATGPARGQINAKVTLDLNMRAGPGMEHGVIVAIPQGTQVPITGCTRRYHWCEVSYSGKKGWVYARHLRDSRGRLGGRPVEDVGEGLGIRILEYLRNAVAGDDGNDADGGRDQRDVAAVKKPEAVEPASAPGKRVGRVCFYDDAGYSGERFCVGPGASSKALDKRWNDRISSFKVSGGLTVEVCKDSGFNGLCRSYGGSYRRLVPDLNDEVSSYRVQ